MVARNAPVPVWLLGREIANGFGKLPEPSLTLDQVLVGWIGLPVDPDRLHDVPIRALSEEECVTELIDITRELAGRGPSPLGGRCSLRTAIEVTRPFIAVVGESELFDADELLIRSRDVMLPQAFGRDLRLTELVHGLSPRE